MSALPIDAIDGFNKMKLAAIKEFLNGRSPIKEDYDKWKAEQEETTD